MRVLFAINPEKSIFQYLVPMAWALRTAGHEVCVASQPAFADVITRAGLTAVPVGRDSDPWRMADARQKVRDGLHAGIPEPYDVAVEPEKATWEYLRDGYAHHVQWWHRLANVPILTDVIEFARWWKPDLVVWEPLTYAGAIAAKACGAAHARMLFGVDVFGLAREHFVRVCGEQAAGQRVDPLAGWLGSYGGRFGFEYSEDLATGHFTIDQFPASLQSRAASLRYVPVRYVPYGGPAVVPDWLTRPVGRPRVALTLGLSATTRFNGYPVDLQVVLDRLADLDVEVVATVAAGEQAKLSRVPANARVVEYVPLHALAPTCAAVIHHAGAATMMTCSLTPTPQLAVHHHYDQPALAGRLAAQGTGIAVAAGDATGEVVRDAVQRLLTDPGHRSAAEKLTAEVWEMPSPNAIVDRLESLTAEYRT